MKPELKAHLKKIVGVLLLLWTPVAVIYIAVNQLAYTDFHEFALLFMAGVGIVCSLVFGIKFVAEKNGSRKPRQ